MIATKLETIDDLREGLIWPPLAGEKVERTKTLGSFLRNISLQTMQLISQYLHKKKTTFLNFIEWHINQKKKNSLYYHSLFEDLVLIGLFKINEHQLGGLEKYIILLKMQELFGRCYKKYLYRLEKLERLDDATISEYVKRDELFEFGVGNHKYLVRKKWENIKEITQNNESQKDSEDNVMKRQKNTKLLRKNKKKNKQRYEPKVNQKHKEQYTKNQEKEDRKANYKIMTRNRTKIHSKIEDQKFQTLSF